MKVTARDGTGGKMVVFNEYGNNVFYYFFKALKVCIIIIICIIVIKNIQPEQKKQIPNIEILLIAKDCLKKY